MCTYKYICMYACKPICKKIPAKRAYRKQFYIKDVKQEKSQPNHFHWESQPLQLSWEGKGLSLSQENTICRETGKT